MVNQMENNKMKNEMETRRIKKGYRDEGFPKLGVPCCGPYTEDSSILRSTPPILGNWQILLQPCNGTIGNIGYDWVALKELKFSDCIMETL